MKPWRAPQFAMDFFFEFAVTVTIEIAKCGEPCMSYCSKYNALVRWSLG